jgi:hypothetical protein
MSEVIGSIIHIGNTETVGSAGTFKKRLLVVKTDEQYPQEVPVEFVQDKCNILDKYSIGQFVKVSINIRGNSYKEKWYCTLNGWKIELNGKANDPNNIQVVEAEVVNLEQPDDLPF